MGEIEAGVGAALTAVGATISVASIIGALLLGRSSSSDNDLKFSALSCDAVLLLGALCLSICPILYAYDDNDDICATRPLLFASGSSLLLGAMVCRTYLSSIFLCRLTAMKYVRPPSEPSQPPTPILPFPLLAVGAELGGT